MPHFRKLLFSAISSLTDCERVTSIRSCTRGTYLDVGSGINGDVGEFGTDAGVGVEEYDGDVGEYDGDVGEYDRGTGEYDGDVGEYDGDVGEYD